jgi:hypothetical protein
VVCHIEARYLSAATLVESIERIEKDSSRWRFEVTNLSFRDPQVSMNRNGNALWWTDGTRARAVADLQEVSCLTRNSCLAQAKSKILHQPILAGSAFGGVLAALLALLYTLFPQDIRRKAAFITALLSFGVTYGTIGVLAFSEGTAMALLVAMSLAIQAILPLIVFNGVLFAVVALMNKRAAASGGSADAKAL